MSQNMGFETSFHKEMVNNCPFYQLTLQDMGVEQKERFLTIHDVGDFLSQLNLNN
jgi:hypothetical protein